MAFEGGTAHVTIYNLDGSVAYEHESPVSAPAATAVSLGPVQFPERLSAVHFIKADLKDSSGKTGVDAISTGARRRSTRTI